MEVYFIMHSHLGPFKRKGVRPRLGFFRLCLHLHSKSVLVLLKNSFFINLKLTALINSGVELNRKARVLQPQSPHAIVLFEK